MDKRPYATLDYEPNRNQFLLKTTPAHNNIARQISPSRWESDIKARSYPASVFSVNSLSKLFRLSPTPVAKTKWLELKQTHLNLDQLRSASKDDILALDVDNYQFHTQPYLHQRLAVSIGQHLDSLALLLDMGLGKSKIAADLLLYRKERGEVKKCLIVCPKSMKRKWGSELLTHTPDIKWTVIHGTPTQRARRYNRSTDAYIINYDLLWRDIKKLKKLNFDMVILDESSLIKNFKAKRTKAAILLSKSAKYKLILTGTPITRNPLDVFYQFKFLDETIFGSRYTVFQSHYAIMGGYGGYEAVAFKNLNELTMLVDKVSVRLSKNDCIDLPDKVYVTRDLTLPTEQKKVYKELQDKLIAEVGNDLTVVTPNVLTQLMKFQQITSGFVMNEDGLHEFSHNPKVDEVLRIVQESDGKIVIWTRFRHDQVVLGKALDKNGIGYYTINGDTKEQDRYDKIEAFQSKEGDRVLIAQIQTLSHGVDLEQASIAIYYGNTFSYSDRVQSEDRIHRITSTHKKVTYIDLIIEESVDQGIYESLVKKSNFAATLKGNNLSEVLKGGKIQK